MEAWHEKSPVKHEHHQCQLCEEYCENSLRKRAKVLLISRRSNQSILKEINPEYSLGGPMLKLMLQYFGHLMQTADSLDKTPMLGKTEGGKRGG